MKLFLYLIAMFFSCVTLTAQELKCNLQINSDKIQGTNKSVFTTLQKSATEFLNNRRWTDWAYEENERIECNVNIIINSVDGDNFSAEMVVQSRRPVYGASYTTNLLNFKDAAFSFTYREFDPLEFNPTSLSSNFTAVLAYYAYIIIGFDMDSFARMGGNSCFQAAESIVTQAQSSDWQGWKAFENDRNRYAVISNIMDEAFKKYREYFFEYHRLGLDEMSVNATNGRAKIASGLPILRDAYRSRPNAVVISAFLDAKNDELINIFKQGTNEEKEQAVDVLTSINPSLTTRYEQILKK